MSAITLLDGGMGQELLARAGDRPTPLWATQVMLDRPELVQAIHADYFAAGATVATANTYAVHRDRLAGTPFADRFEALLAQALDAARAARDAHGGGRIAASTGPLVQSYRPDKMPPHDRAVAIYAEVANLLAPRCDILLAETVASVAHARAFIEAAAPIAARHGIPLWLAVTLSDTDGTVLRSGEPIAALAPVLGPVDSLLANCSAPEAMDTAMPHLAALGRPFGALANGFEQITEDFLREKPTADALTARRDMGPERYADHAMGWVAAGATLVGGCCETGPAHIAEIARRLRAAGHTIV